METIRSLFYRNDPNQTTTNKSLFKVKDLSLSYVSIIDPMVVTYFVTMLSSIAVAISCTCIWAILYMNVALQFFVAAETAHFKKKDNDVHIMVTLSLLPTILLFWTFIMWLVISRQIEIIYLMYTTPFFSNDKQSPFSINHNNTADMETETDTANGNNNINSNIDENSNGILNISTSDWIEEDNNLANARRNEEEAKQQMQQALSIHPYNTTPSTTTTGNTTANNNNTLGNSTTPIDNRKDIIYKIAHEYSDLLWNELQLKHYEQNVYRNKKENAENLYNKAKLLSQNAQNTYSLCKKLSLPLSEEEKQILPKYENLENLLYNTTKTVKRAYDHTQHKFYCNWSENMLETPFNMPILNQYSWKFILILCIILEITITAICYSSGVIDGYNTSIIIVVFTGILLMLWSILDTGECCSRAFWIIWCYFAISAILTALCSLANNNWSNQFITTAVIIYISIMFTIFAMYIAYDIWILPIFEFWTSTEYLNTWYIAVFIIFILGMIAFLCAFLLYEFQNDENGWFCRLAYQLCWILPLVVMVGKTYFFPHTILVCKCSNNAIIRENLQSCEVSELDEMIDSTCNIKKKCQKCDNNQSNNSHSTTSATTKIHVETQLPTVLEDNESQEDHYHPSVIKISTPYQSAYGRIEAGDWMFYFRLVGIGYLFMLLGVLGGSVMAGYVGILNILTYCAGPVVLYCSTWSILYIMNIIFTKKQLHTAGWSFHTALEVAIQGRDNKSRSWIEIIRSLYSSPILPLWAWDYFQIHTLCLLLAFIVISIYAELVMILLFTVLILLQGYSMIEYHFYHIPITTKISLGGYKIADLHAPRRRLPVLLLLSLFLANLIIMAIVTWSLTNSYNNNTTPIVYKEDMQVNINSPKYPICDTQSFYTLDIIDLAYLTQLTYFHDPVNVNEDCGVENNENLKKCLDYYFIPQYTKDVTAGEGYNWTVLNISIPTGTTDSHRVAYYGIKSENTNVIVVGVRGTTTGRDWLEDFNLYTESCLLQLFSLAIPMTYIWPYSATAALVKALSFTQKILYSTQQNNIEASYYYEPVQSYTEELQFLYPNYNIILLGHSLGGATAQIAAARMNIRGIGFEPPGIVFTKEKFHISQDSKDTGINRNLISVLRNNDPISYIDEHAGEIQHLDCNSRFLTAYCHYTMPIICHLMANCNATERVSFDHWGGGYAYCGMT